MRKLEFADTVVVDPPPYAGEDGPTAVERAPAPYASAEYSRRICDANARLREAAAAAAHARRMRFRPARLARSA